MLNELTRKLVSGKNLSKEEAENALEYLFDEGSTDRDISNFLIALFEKGETPEEIAGFAKIMRQHAVLLQSNRTALVDTAGTGGGKPSFNVSTTAAFVVAGAGIAVAKHGNRAVTSTCGSADVLEALGVRIDSPIKTVQSCLDRNGLAFLFAPAFHPAMKRVAAIRKQIPHRTIFNLLGPLTNPANAPFQLIGVFEAELVPKLGKALYLLGTGRSWISHSLDGLDEISVLSPTKIIEVTSDKLHEFEINPVDYGFSYVSGSLKEGQGGNPAANAKICLEILKGERHDFLRDLVLINAAAAIHLATDKTFDESLKQAKLSISGGMAYQKLQELIETSNHDSG